jgi:predicted O-methyltransferase YrrM
MNNFSIEDIKNLIDKAMLEEPINPFLDSRYQEVEDLVGHGQPYYKLFYYLAQELKPKTVVELGGWRGYGSAHFAAGNVNSTVISIDHHSDPGDEVNQQKMLECTKEYSNMHYVQGWTTPEYAKEYSKGANGYDKVLKILGGKKISCLFIDSWHEGRYLLRDWSYYSPLLDKNSLVVVDDIFDSESFIGMVKAWNSLPGEKFIDSRPHVGIPMGFIKYEY